MAANGSNRKAFVAYLNSDPNSFLARYPDAMCLVKIPDADKTAAHTMGLGTLDEGFIVMAFFRARLLSYFSVISMKSKLDDSAK